jgi:hypothetical protein
VSSIHLKEIFRLLGVNKDEKEVLRILDGTIPRVDFVNLGANGYGEEGFLVKKGRDMAVGTLQNVDGKWVFVAKGEGETEDKKDEKPGIKMSGATKQGLAAQIAALQKLHDEADEDDSAEGVPEEVLQVLGVVKDAEPEDKQEAKPEPDPKPAPEPEIQVPAHLQAMVKSITEAAGDAAESKEVQAQINALLGTLAPENQAVAAVSKRLDGELAEVKKHNAKLEKMVKALTQAGVAGGYLIPDGTQTKQETTKKSKAPNPFGAAPGMDLSKVGDDPDAIYTIPQ